MAQIGAVFVFCSSCKILYFASSVHPKNATVVLVLKKFNVSLLDLLLVLEKLIFQLLVLVLIVNYWIFQYQYQ